MGMVARRAVLVGLAALLASAGARPAGAVFIGNTQGGADFPEGATSFADAVVDYVPVVNGGQPTPAHREPSQALDVPDYAGVNDCTAAPLDCSFVSLGDGGSLTLRFLDNALTGSGDTGADLFIFEVGPDVENTFVEISMDGLAWDSVGSVGGSFSTVDIDAFGFGPTDLFFYVRLTDDEALDGQTGITVGADIDAVGAISTVLTPEPTGALLLACGLLSLGLKRRRSAP